MSWAGAARPRIQPSVSVEPTPVSSAPPQATPAPPPPDQPSTGSINLDLTSPNPVSAYHPEPGAGFSNDILNQGVGLVTGLVGGAIGVAADAAHAVDQIVGAGVSTATGNRAYFAQVNTLKNFVDSEDTPEKRAAQAEMAKFPNDQFKQSQIAWDYLDRHQAYLFPELLQPFDTTLTGIAWNTIGLLQAPQQVIGRTSAGIFGNMKIDPALLAGGFGGVSSVTLGDRISNIRARAANPSTAASVTPTEDFALQQVDSGQWTKDQGLDFLAGHGAAFSNDLATEMTASLVTDPTIVIPFAAEAAKLGAATRVVRGGALIENVMSAAQDGNKVASAMVNVGKKVNDIADPVGAIWGRAPKPLMISPETTDAINAAKGWVTDPGARAAIEMVPMVRSAYNYPMRLGSHLTELDPSGALNADLASAEATYTGSLLRRVILRRHLTTIIATGDPGALIRDKIVPDDLIGELINAQPHNVAELVERDALSVIKPIETVEDRTLLAERLARGFGQDAEHWAGEMVHWSANDLSYAHAMTYAREQQSLFGAVQRLLRTGVKTFNPKRLTLINASTMTQDGAAKILREVDATLEPGSGAGAELEQAAAILRVAQKQYARDLGWITLDGTGADLERQVTVLRNWLEDRIFRADLPSEINPRELAEMSKTEPELARMHADGQAGNAPWKLGYAPDETARWGLLQDGNGNWHARFDVWATHVAVNTAGYQPLSLPLRFVEGRIAGYASNKLADAVDMVENASRVMTHSVTSALVTENARIRLATGLRKSGFTDEEAGRLINGVNSLVAQREAPIRSLLPGDLWNSLGSLVPARLSSTKAYTKENLVGDIMRAYQGDFRYVGVSQYLTGGMKRAVPLLGHMAEDVVPFMRFKLSLIFPTQMRIEGPFWSSVRGIKPAFGPTPGEIDAQTAGILQRMAETSGRRASDLDASVEMSKQAMIGQELAQLGQEKWGQTWLQKITNAKGVEQLNYFRQFRHELYTMMKDIADRSGFDLDKALATYLEPVTGRSGRWGNVVEAGAQPIPDQDEAVVRWLHELIGQEANPDAIVKPGTKLVSPALDANIYAPTNIGELRPVDVDGFLKRAPISVGEREYAKADDLRKAIYRHEITPSQVETHLRDLNVPEDNIDRFMRAVSFDWNSFWRDASRKFGMTLDETRSLQEAITGMARKQRMSPSEYLSQIISPTIGNGDQALVRHIGDTVDLMRKMTAKQAITGGISRLNAPLEGGSAELLAKQLANVFVENLHPSARETLMEEFGVEEAALADRMAQEAMARTAEAAPLPPSAAQVAARDAAEAGLPPDAERVMREFGKWATDHVANGMLAGKDITPEARGVLDRMGLIPTDYAAPYNKSQAMMMNAVFDHMAQKENDAFSLMYWRRSRSFLERSINHPLFGIYPASYMWGKVAPGYIKFLAKDPFGFKTGVGVNALRNVQMSLAARREFDPEFQAQLDKLSKSEALWFVGYLLPGAPWDLGASTPAWAQELLRQADANAGRVRRGLPPNPLNLQNLLESQSNFLNPARGIAAGADALSETQHALQGVQDNLFSQPQQPQPVDLGEPVHAAGLQPVLAPEIERLQQLLLR